MLENAKVHGRAPNMNQQSSTMARPDQERSLCCLLFRRVYDLFQPGQGGRAFRPRSVTKRAARCHHLPQRAFSFSKRINCALALTLSRPRPLFATSAIIFRSRVHLFAAAHFICDERASTSIALLALLRPRPFFPRSTLRRRARDCAHVLGPFCSRAQPSRRARFGRAKC